VKWPEVRVAAPAEQIFKQMPGIMRKRVNTLNVACKPTWQQVNGERKAIHLNDAINSAPVKHEIVAEFTI